MSKELKALVVEDNAGYRTILSSWLTDFDFQTRAVSTVKEASDELIDTDLLILDMRLTDGTGLDVLKTLDLLQHDIPVIVVSAYPEYRDQTVYKNIVIWLNKPFSLGQFRDAIIQAKSVMREISALKDNNCRLEQLVRHLRKEETLKPI